MEELQQIAVDNNFKIVTTYEPNREIHPTYGDLTYLVEIVGEPGDVYAQGFGATIEQASAACLSDWKR